MQAARRTACWTQGPTRFAKEGVRTPSRHSAYTGRVPTLPTILLALGSGLLLVDPSAGQDLVQQYQEEVRPVLESHCFSCHGEERQKADFRVDELDPDLLIGEDAEAWSHVLDLINLGDMPPRKADPLDDAERRLVVEWLNASLSAAAEARSTELEPILRRLNKQQYTHTVAELLGLEASWGKTLPDDAKSKLGFTNNGEVLQASPLHIETYQEIARQAIADSIVLGPRPEPVRYRVEFGKGIGAGLVGGQTGGYQSVIFPQSDFRIDVLDRDGALLDDPELDAIRRRISVGLRGSQQSRWRSVPEGVVLYGALPHREVAPGAWQGPSPNIKLELQRVFPDHGTFEMRVTASRGYLLESNERLLIPLEDPRPLTGLDEEVPFFPYESTVYEAAKGQDRSNLSFDGTFLRPSEIPKDSSVRYRLEAEQAGYWQFDLVHPSASPDAMPSIRFQIANLKLDQRLTFDEVALRQSVHVTPLGAAYLPEGAHDLRLGGKFFVGFSHLVATPIPDEHPAVATLQARSEEAAAEALRRVPSLRAFVGTRTDDGMDYATFGEPIAVPDSLDTPGTYTFRGRLEDLPVPEPESGDTEILSGFTLMGVWNDHLVKTSKDPGPPLMLHAIEVEAPIHDTWPPATHQRIFLDSPRRADESQYAREVIGSFMQRAFRRPVPEHEVQRYYQFWQDLRPEFDSFEESVGEVLVAVLCSPHFLFMVEPEMGADDLELDEHSLANRLSYFLWNSPPDEELMLLADRGALRANLDAQVERLLDDRRSSRFTRAFTREWLRMDRQALMTINVDLHRDYTRFVKRDMEEETLAFMEHVVREDLPVGTLIDSDFVMLNQNLAEFYGIEGVEGTAFRPVEVPREEGRGGLLSQGSFLVGHSNGTEPHAIKRAVWLKEKILGEHPPPPPPNVPNLNDSAPDTGSMTLKERLFAHRDNPSCRDCHAGIDPYGLVFEEYSAVGRLETSRKGRPIDASTTLPDGTALDGVASLKKWILEERHDAFARAFTEYLFAWALGRDTNFADEAELARLLEAVRGEGFGIRSVVRAIVSSDSFQGR